MIILEARRHSLYGFHGAPESCAMEIYETRTFNSGDPRKDHWLGQGAYFFKDDEEQALIWAKTKVKNHPKYKGEHPCVIEVILEVDEPMFLNLDSRKGLIQLKEYIEVFRKLYGMKIDVNSSLDKMPAEIRCYLLSLLPEYIWMIQRTFKVDSMFDKDDVFVSMELQLLGTQICVRNNEVIKTNSMKLRKFPPPVTKKANKKPRVFGK